jgi:L-threonylcarbamoyladenylate synthase
MNTNGEASTRKRERQTAVVHVDQHTPNPSDILRAAECLRRGGLVAFPTETVYGLGVHALDRDAVRRLFDAKGRPANDPLIVHVASFDQVTPLVRALPEPVEALAGRFWPGPLTLVLPRAPSVPAEVTAGLQTIAVRIPAHPVAQALLSAAGIPVAAPSANLFSRPSPTRAEHVLEDLDGRIDMVIDAGATIVGVESTVLDLTSDPPVVLRPGAVTVEALQRILPGLRPAPVRRADAPMPSPGLLPKHYAPRAPMTLYRGQAEAARNALVAAARGAIRAGRRVGVLATTGDEGALEGMAVVVAGLGADEDAEGESARLYAALRELDAAQVDVILARDASREDGLWRALRDRLQRAATHIVDTG